MPRTINLERLPDQSYCLLRQNCATFVECAFGERADGTRRIECRASNPDTRVPPTLVEWQEGTGAPPSTTPTWARTLLQTVQAPVRWLTDATGAPRGTAPSACWPTNESWVATASDARDLLAALARPASSLDALELLERVPRPTFYVVTVLGLPPHSTIVLVGDHQRASSEAATNERRYTSVGLDRANRMAPLGSIKTFADAIAGTCQSLVVSPDPAVQDLVGSNPNARIMAVLRPTCSEYDTVRGDFRETLETVLECCKGQRELRQRLAREYVNAPPHAPPHEQQTRQARLLADLHRTVLADADQGSWSEPEYRWSDDVAAKVRELAHATRPFAQHGAFRALMEAASAAA